MFVDIIDPRSPSNVKFSMGNFYRPPHTTVAQLKLFIRYFSQKLTELNSNNTAFVCGDYNINLLLVDSDEHSGSYFDGILASTITLPIDALLCKNTSCTKHCEDIDSFYTAIITALKLSAKHCIPSSVASTKCYIVPG